MATTTQLELDALRLELSVKAKNGINFILAASLVWLLIALVWTLPYHLKSRAILTFMVGALLLPLAWLLSKLFRTAWTIKTNPLQPLGLWLNFAQLLYFPILIFVFLRQLEYFLLVYAVITGAHLFPYAWFYKTLAYAVIASISSVGSMVINLWVSPHQLYFIPLFVAGSLVILGIWVGITYRANKQEYSNLSSAEVT